MFIQRFIFEVIVLSKKNGKWERFWKLYSNLWKGKEMERNAVQFRYCGKERESFPVLTGRKGKEMLSEKNGQVNMYGWQFVKPRFTCLFNRRQQVQYNLGSPEFRRYIHEFRQGNHDTCDIKGKFQDNAFRV